MFSSYRASKILGIKSRSLRALVKRGFIPAIRTDGRWRFRPADLFAYKKWGPPLQRTGTAARIIGVHPRTLISWTRAGLVSRAHDDFGILTNAQHQRLYDRDQVMEIAKLRQEHGRRLVRALHDRMLTLGPLSPAT